MSVRVVTGSIAVSLLDGRIIECVGRGYLRRDHVITAQHAIGEILATRPGPLDSLFDGAAIETFEPGLPMEWIRWSMSRNLHPHRVAIVGRPGPMLSVAKTFTYLLPKLRFGLFANRADALNFLHEVER